MSDVERERKGLRGRVEVEKEGARTITREQTDRRRDQHAFPTSTVSCSRRYTRAREVRPVHYE